MARPKAHWIRLDHGVHDHPKIVSCAISLQVTRETVVGHLTRLWIWCSMYRPNGQVGDVGIAMLSEASGWRGDPELWAKTLESNRLIVKHNRGKQLRGWKERNDYQNRERERKAEVARSNSARLARVERTISAPTQRTEQNNTKDIQNAREARSSPRKRVAATVSAIAIEEVKQYETLSGWPANKAAQRSAHRLLETGKGEELLAARQAYAHELTEKDVPREYRIRPHNLYGKAARWETYKHAIAPSDNGNGRPREYVNRLLTPEEKAELMRFIGK